MTAREVRILSYFSLPTDLAAAMRAWPEFVGGAGYDVDLRSPNERVEVRFATDELIVRGQGDGELFDKVLGRVVHALAPHSDYVGVQRYD